MVKDRLDEFKENANSNRNQNGVEGLEMVVLQIDSPVYTFMDDFFNLINSLTDQLETLKGHVDNVDRCHNNILSAPVTDDKMKDDLEKNVNSIKNLSRQIRNQIKEQQEIIDKDNLSSNNLRAEPRIRSLQITNISYRLNEIMHEYNRVQVDYRSKCKERIQRQLQIMGDERTDDQIEDMLESNVQIFSEKMLEEAKLAKQTLVALEERHQDILSLEKSIRELHEMFTDMAMLVESQGQMIENIERAMTKSTDYIADAKVQVKSALTYQRAARRKKIIIIIIIIVVILIVVLILVILLLKYLPKSNNNNSNNSNNNSNNNNNNNNNSSGKLASLNYLLSDHTATTYQTLKQTLNVS
jgi:t-SNARE complex subunit (syntaxin)